VLLLLGGTAHADPVRVHLEAAATVEGSGTITSVAFRGYLGVSLQQPGEGARGFIGAGAHLGSGVLDVKDPRAADQYLELSFETLGPEARLGAVFVDGGYVDTQLYVAIAPLQVGVDPRLMYDRVDGIHGGSGLRVAVGATYADRLVRTIGNGQGDVYLLMLPETFELVWEKSAGSIRGGASFGWGF